jgi:hypothetical protein
MSTAKEIGIPRRGALHELGSLFHHCSKHVPACLMQEPPRTDATGKSQRRDQEL